MGLPSKFVALPLPLAALLVTLHRWLLAWAGLSFTYNDIQVISAKVCEYFWGHPAALKIRQVLVSFLVELFPETTTRSTHLITSFPLGIPLIRGKQKGAERRNRTTVQYSAPLFLQSRAGWGSIIQHESKIARRESRVKGNSEKYKNMVMFFQCKGVLAPLFGQNKSYPLTCNMGVAHQSMSVAHPKSLLWE